MSFLVTGSLAVCLVGLLGEAPVAWSPLLHSTASQEMRAASKHTGTVRAAELSSAAICCFIKLLPRSLAFIVYLAKDPKLDFKCVLVEPCLQLLWVLSFCLQESEDDHKLPALNLLICLVARFDSIALIDLV